MQEKPAEEGKEVPFYDRESDGTVERNEFKGFSKWVWEAQTLTEGNR